MALESLPKIAPALFSADQDLIQIYNKKSDTTGVINPSYIKSSPSGVAGAIQFSDGSAFASDSANLFWDDTNNRLGIGTSSPAYPLEVVGAINGFSLTGSSGDRRLFSNSNYFFLGKDTSNMLQFYNGTISTAQFDGTAKFNIRGNGSTSATTSLLVQNSSATELMRAYDDGNTKIGYNAYLNAADPYTPSPPFSFLDQVDGILAINQQTQWANFIGVTRNGGTGDSSLSLFGLGTGGGYQGSIRFWTSGNTRTPSLAMIVDRSQNVGIGLTNSTNLTATARLQVKGSGSTSATTSLLVQNSAGTELFRVRDDGRLSAQSINVTGFPAYLISNVNVMDYGSGLRIGYDGSVQQITFYTNSGTPQLAINNSNQVYVGTTSPQASAKFEIASTTMGFLPPRMTTAQKNAIATPAAGLVVFDTDLNKLCVRGASAWETITSV